MAENNTHIEKILTLLASGEVEVKLLLRMPYGYEGLWGCRSDRDEKELWVKKGLSLNSVVRILIHECLHWLNPRRGEGWVLAREDEIYTSITGLERKDLEAFLQKCEKKQRHETMLRKRQEARCRAKRLVARRLSLKKSLR